MSDIALRVEGLGKRYRLGLQDPAASGGMYRYKSLRDTFGNLARRPLQTVRDTVVRGPMTDDNAFWALKDVNFEVKRGDVVGIIGRNGAGKSTLLKVLSRITKPTTGRVDLFGRVGSLLEVGTGFHPELTGRENIYLNGAILGMTRAEVKAKFDEIVAFSEVEKFLDMAVKQYSSGMYTRLAFAVAAHLDPEILVVDEVLAVGDAEFQKKCLGKMKDVAREGRTIFFVSHNLSQIQRLCGRCVLLTAGRVHSVASTAEVVATYTSLFRSKKTNDRPQRFLPDVSISGCTVTPPLVGGTDTLEVSVSLSASQMTIIEDLAILICVDSDTRIVSFDLHGLVIPRRMPAGDVCSFSVRAISLPLVDREYTIGIFCRSSTGYDAAYNLAAFEVLPPVRTTGSHSYKAADRGYAAIPFDATAEAL